MNFTTTIDGRDVAMVSAVAVSPGFDTAPQEGDPRKECQDEAIFQQWKYEGNDILFFGVFDGHGPNGRKVGRHSRIC